MSLSGTGVTAFSTGSTEGVSDAQHSDTPLGASVGGAGMPVGQRSNFCGTASGEKQSEHHEDLQTT